jgi:hypothetical protein
MNALLQHPHRRTASIAAVLAGGALLFLAPEAGGLFGAAMMLAGFAVEGWAVFRKHTGR